MQEIAMVQTGVKEALSILKSIRLEEGKIDAKTVGLLESEKTRIQNYEPISGLAGDECFNYFVKWNEETSEYIYGVLKDGLQ